MPESSVPPSPDVPAEAWSGVHRGPLREGEWVRLSTRRVASTTSSSTAGKRFFSNKGHLEHDEMIGREEGFVVTSSAAGQYLVFRPLLSEFVVSMPRGAAVVYPKDAAQIVALADIYPGARVVEAGAGSGALTCSLLRAVGPWGRVTSFELREEFAEVAKRNVDQFFNAPAGTTHPAWDLQLGDLKELLPRVEGQVDRIILDMLDPWNCVDVVADKLAPGGIVCAYVATTTQLSRVVETLRAHGGFTEPHPWESMVRDWHVEGLAVRPDHKMIGHTAFLVTARKMAPGEKALRKTRRPAPGAYGVDYTGPRPADLPPLETPEVGPTSSDRGRRLVARPGPIELRVPSPLTCVRRWRPCRGRGSSTWGRRRCRVWRPSRSWTST